MFGVIGTPYIARPRINRIARRATTATSTEYRNENYPSCTALFLTESSTIVSPAHPVVTFAHAPHKSQGPNYELPIYSVLYPYSTMSPIGVAIIGGGIFVKEQHLVSSACHHTTLLSGAAFG